MSRQLLVFTDLDGTLLDHDSYAWKPAARALRRLSELDIPLIFNSSKTATEIVELRQELQNSHPYIVENGGAVFLPTETGEEIHHFGANYQQIRRILTSLRNKHDYPFSGFADMGPDGVVAATGLDKASAEAACDRQSTEPLLWQGDDAHLEAFRQDLAKEGLQLVKGGRFFHVMGQTDKGLAMNWLTERYRQADPETKFVLVALGDGPNDLPMLQLADIAVVLRPQTGPALTVSGHTRVIRPGFPGPNGWQEALDEIFHLYL